MTMAACSRSRSGLDVSTLDDDQGGLTVIIKFSGNQIYTIDTNIHQTVKDLKELVANEANISPRNLNFVLAGQILADSNVLGDCGLGAHTTLHAFCWSDDGLGVGDLLVTQTAGHGSVAGNGQQRIGQSHGVQAVRAENIPSRRETTQYGESDVDGDLFSLPRSVNTAVDVKQPVCQTVTRRNEHNRFFVFCKLCDCVRPAKLRLKCLECGNGAFLVDRGPSNWDDISAQTSIRGTCKTEGCKCDIPKFYLRCNQSHDGEVEGTAVALKHVQANRRRVECIICGDVMSHVLIFPCSPGHVTCLDCFSQYGSSCLSERRFVEHSQHGYTLPCPAGCLDSHIEETHHFLLLGPDKYERYKNFAAEEYVLQNGGILCPGQGCGMGLFPEEDERLVKCRECQFESCKGCHRQFHAGSCEDYTQSLQLNLSELSIDEDRAERACWERQSLSLIEETTKTCPGCHIKTERSGGCMHMVCSRCGKEWCWICVKPWSRDCQSDHWFG